MKLRAYSVGAAAKLLGVSCGLIYIALRDGRLERGELLGGGATLVAADSVEACLSDPARLKRLDRKCGSALDDLGIEEVRMRLIAGATYEELGAEVGVSRQRVEQWLRAKGLRDSITRTCWRCGKPLIGSTNGTRYHDACARDLSQERHRLRGWHQRETLTEFEELALLGYQARGYDVNWAPHQAPFDFLVNGHRVDTKGSHVVGRGYFKWTVRPHGRNGDLHFDDLPQRCEVYHCIGIDGDDRFDLMWTAEEVGERKVLGYTPPRLAKYAGCNSKKRDRWELLEDALS